MIQLKADPSSKPHFIQTLLSSEVYFEGRQEGDSFRIYDQNRSDGSKIIDLYTNEHLLRQADGVNPDYCAHLNAFTLLMLLKEQNFFVSLNHTTSNEMTFTPDEVRVMLGVVPVHEEELDVSVAVKILKQYPKEWVQPIAAVCQRFKSARAAYLGVMDNQDQENTPLCVLLLIDMASSNERETLKTDLFNVSIELLKTRNVEMKILFHEQDDKHSSDDFVTQLMEQTEPFYIQSKANQWRQRLGLPPTIAAKTI